MTYQVLARKWRPRRFSELVGQAHVVRALSNALQQNRLHHAYLFTGTRGVGKTTLARIFAKALSCEAGIVGEPCCACGACKDIDEGRYVDLVEVDAASRTKVDDTRDMLDNVPYAPNRGRFKVYLIDEVHMFSAHSFNALLKTLEEPPPHVKFLLATTDPKKLPVTILSRCLQFNLKHVAVDGITVHLEKILLAEGIENDAAGRRLIAKAADGSVRDALSLLDQAIAFGGGQLRESDVRALLGTVNEGQVIELLQAVATRNANAVFSAIECMAEYDPDYHALLGEVLSLLHDAAIFLAVGGNPGLHPNNAIDALASVLTPEDCQLYYQIALTGRRDLSLAADARDGFEMTMLRMLTFAREISGEINAGSQTISIVSEKKLLEPASLKTDQAKQDVNHAVVAAEASAEVAPKLDAATKLEVVAACDPPDGEIALPPIPAETLSDKPPATESEWLTMIQSMQLNGLSRELAVNCAFETFENDTLTLIVTPSLAHLRNDRLEQRLQEQLRVRYGPGLRLKIRSADLGDRSTPAATLALQEQEALQAARSTLENDRGVRKLQEAFGAHIITDSVRSS